MKSKQSCPRGQGLPNLKTEASSPQLARKRYFDAPSNSLIRLTCYFSLNRCCFVLLDEILKGTNSDDKHSGTVGFIKKLLSQKAIGVIATHDLEVCHMTGNFPSQLRNSCFEVEIINNDLFFDYKLREGICKNKSATFLMKKMSII